MVIIKKIGSLKFGVVVMSVLLVVMAWATFVENSYEPAVAQFAVYGSWWFEVLLAVFGVNILAATLTRWPWTLKQLPFLVAHFGILFLLLGCFLTARFGTEAQISIYEGEMARFAFKPSESEIALRTAYFNQNAKDVGRDEEKIPKTDDPRIKPKTQLLRQQLDDMRRFPKISVPVKLGPFHWSEYSPKNWFLPDRKHKYTLFLPVQVALRSTGTVYDKEGVKIEILDFYADSTLKPVPPLKIQTLWGRPDAEKVPTDSTPTEWETFELPLNAVADSPEHRMVRQLELYSKSDTAKNGERLSFRLAKSLAETRAFTEIKQPEDSGLLGKVVFHHVGTNYEFSMDELRKEWDEQTPKREENRIKTRDVRQKYVELLAEENGDAPEIKDEIARLEKEIADLKNEQENLSEATRHPLGETGLTIELVRPMPQMLSAVFQIRAKDGNTQSIYLFADAPETNTFSERFGVAARYFFDPTTFTNAPTSGDSLNPVPSAVLERARQPRLELLQGTDKKLYYRYSTDGQTRFLGEIDPALQELSIAEGTEHAVKLKIVAFTPQDFPGTVIEQLPFAKSMGGRMPVPRVLVRAGIDGISEQYWLSRSESMVYSPQEGQTGYVTGKNKTVSVTFAYPQVDLGFGMYLRKFERILDPGTQIAAHYASLIDLYDIDNIDGPALEQGILIKMNQPGMFRDQISGRKYRVYQSSFAGPYVPGTPQYDSQLGGLLFPMEKAPRDQLYVSVFSVNYDPGRGIKYLGSLMIVLGGLWLLTRRK